MKKQSKTPTPTPNFKASSPADPTATVHVHVRRCHVCDHVNEVENAAVHKCMGCGKYLAPFYYFNETELDGLKENGFYLSLWKTVQSYHPIWGLSTYWDEKCPSSTSN